MGGGGTLVFTGVPATMNGFQRASSGDASGIAEAGVGAFATTVGTSVTLYGGATVAGGLGYGGTAAALGTAGTAVGTAVLPVTVVVVVVAGGVYLYYNSDDINAASQAALAPIHLREALKYRYSCTSARQNMGGAEGERYRRMLEDYDAMQRSAIKPALTGCASQGGDCKACHGGR